MIIFNDNRRERCSDSLFRDDSSFIHFGFFQGSETPN